MESLQWPTTPVPSEVKDLLALFFRLIDTVDPNAGQLIAEKVFTSDGLFIGGVGTFHGKEEIATSRARAWDVISLRKHVVERVYAGDKTGRDLILAGTLETRTKGNPKPTFQEFCARAIVDGKRENTRLKEYQAYCGRFLSPE